MRAKSASAIKNRAAIIAELEAIENGDIKKALLPLLDQEQHERFLTLIDTQQLKDAVENFNQIQIKLNSSNMFPPHATMKAKSQQALLLIGQTLQLNGTYPKKLYVEDLYLALSAEVLMQEKEILSALEKMKKYIDPKDHQLFVKILLESKIETHTNSFLQDMGEAITNSVSAIKDIKDKYKKSLKLSAESRRGAEKSLRDIGISSDKNQKEILSLVMRQLKTRKVNDLGAEISDFREKVINQIIKENAKDDKDENHAQLVKFIKSISDAANALKMSLGNFFHDDANDNVEKRVKQALDKLEKIYNTAMKKDIQGAREKFKDFYTDYHKEFGIKEPLKLEPIKASAVPARLSHSKVSPYTPAEGKPRARSFLNEKAHKQSQAPRREHAETQIHPQPRTSKNRK